MVVYIGFRRNRKHLSGETGTEHRPPQGLGGSPYRCGLFTLESTKGGEREPHGRVHVLGYRGVQ